VTPPPDRGGTRHITEMVGFSGETDVTRCAGSPADAHASERLLVRSPSVEIGPERLSDAVFLEAHDPGAQ
jgi:hypothetical protein